MQMLDGCSTNTSLKSYSWKCSSLLVIDFLLPTYKVAIGTPEFKRIWLSATFIICPLLRHSLYKIMHTPPPVLMRNPNVLAPPIFL